MKRLCLIYLLDSADLAADYLYRAGFFYSNGPISKFRIFRKGNWCERDLKVPHNLCTEANNRYHSFIQYLEIIDLKSEKEISNYLEGCDAFLLGSKAEEWDYLEKACRQLKVPCWSVDKIRTRQEGSFWIEAYLYFQEEADLSLLRKRSRLNFEVLEKSIQSPVECATIYATRPSVSKYKEFLDKPSLGIICNSIIMDDELLDHIQPRILCFADPIFHFGPSRYAEIFRNKVIEVVDRFSLTVIVPEKYALLLSDLCPQLTDHIVSLEYDGKLDFVVDYSDSLKVKSTGKYSHLFTSSDCLYISRTGIRLIGCEAPNFRK